MDQAPISDKGHPADQACTPDKSSSPDTKLLDLGPSCSQDGWISWPAPALKVSTLAGSSAGAQDGPVATAKFYFPRGVAVDGSGKIYVADSGNHRVRLIANGQVSTLAGSSKGFKDGPAATAQFAFPWGIAVDASGAVYVADSENQRIRLIKNGQVTTFAGDGTAWFKDGPAAAASFNYPEGLALEGSGKIYVADRGNQRVRLIASGQVSTLAGSGTTGLQDGAAASAKFNKPTAVLVAGNAQVLVVDSGNHRIRRVANGQVSTWAGSTFGQLDSVSLCAKFDWPKGVTMDATGRVFVADGNDVIRSVLNDQVTTWAGFMNAGFADGPVDSAKFDQPCGLAVDGKGNLIVGDSGNDRIRLISP